MNDFEMLRPLGINIDVTEGIAQAVQAGSIGEKDDVFRWVKMTDDEVAGQYSFEGIEFMLMLREP